MILSLLYLHILKTAIISMGKIIAIENIYNISNTQTVADDQYKI